MTKQELTDKLLYAKSHLQVAMGELEVAVNNLALAERNFELTKNDAINQGMVTGENEAKRRASLSDITYREGLDIYQCELKLREKRTKVEVARYDWDAARYLIKLWDSDIPEVEYSKPADTPQ